MQNATNDKKPQGERPAGERPQRDARGPRPPREEEAWKPQTKLGRLVNNNTITDIKDIFKYSLPIKETQIIDKFLTLKEQVVTVKSVQKVTSAGQRTRFRAVVIVGNSDGFIGYGTGVSKEVAVAVKKAVTNAKLNVVPVRRGYWFGKLGLPHTINSKISGKCGSCKFRLIPAPRGTGIVAASKVIDVIALSGLQDVYTRQFGHTRTLTNSVGAFFDAIRRSYTYLTPDLWAEQPFGEDIRFAKE